MQLRRDGVGPEVFLRDSARVSDACRAGLWSEAASVSAANTEWPSPVLLQGAAAPPEAFPLHLSVQAGEGVRPHQAAGRHGGLHGKGEEKMEPSSAARA